MAPLLGLISLLCAYWFLVIMPVIAVVFGWQDRRSRKLSTGLVTAVVMILAYLLSAALIWRLGTPDWKLSFLTTLEATVNAQKYGNAVEHRAERIIIWLLIYSAVAAGFAGAITSVLSYSWIRRRRARHKGALQRL